MIRCGLRAVTAKPILGTVYPLFCYMRKDKIYPILFDTSLMAKYIMLSKDHAISLTTFAYVKLEIEDMSERAYLSTYKTYQYTSIRSETITDTYPDEIIRGYTKVNLKYELKYVTKTFDGVDHTNGVFAHPDFHDYVRLQYDYQNEGILPKYYPPPNYISNSNFLNIVPLYTYSLPDRVLNYIHHTWAEKWGATLFIIILYDKEVYNMFEDKTNVIYNGLKITIVKYERTDSLKTYQIRYGDHTSYVLILPTDPKEFTDELRNTITRLYKCVDPNNTPSGYNIYFDTTATQPQFVKYIDVTSFHDRGIMNYLGVPFTNETKRSFGVGFLGAYKTHSPVYFQITNSAVHPLIDGTRTRCRDKFSHVMELTDIPKVTIPKERIPVPVYKYLGDTLLIQFRLNPMTYKYEHSNMNLEYISEDVIDDQTRVYYYNQGTSSRATIDVAYDIFVKKCGTPKPTPKTIQGKYAFLCRCSGGPSNLSLDMTVTSSRVYLHNKPSSLGHDIFMLHATTYVNKLLDGTPVVRKPIPDGQTNNYPIIPPEDGYSVENLTNDIDISMTKPSFVGTLQNFTYRSRARYTHSEVLRNVKSCSYADLRWIDSLTDWWTQKYDYPCLITVKADPNFNSRLLPVEHIVKKRDDETIESETYSVRTKAWNNQIVIPYAYVEDGRVHAIGNILSPGLFIIGDNYIDFQSAKPLTHVICRTSESFNLELHGLALPFYMQGPWRYGYQGTPFGVISDDDNNPPRPRVDNNGDLFEFIDSPLDPTIPRSEIDLEIATRKRPSYRMTIDRDVDMNGVTISEPTQQYNPETSSFQDVVFDPPPYKFVPTTEQGKYNIYDFKKIDDAVARLTNKDYIYESISGEYIPLPADTIVYQRGIGLSPNENPTPSHMMYHTKAAYRRSIIPAFETPMRDFGLSSSMQSITIQLLAKRYVYEAVGICHERDLDLYTKYDKTIVPTYLTAEEMSNIQLT